MEIKPIPVVSENQTVRQCSKCAGTGFWCLGWNGDRPISNTGTKCFPCNGTGWIVKEKRAKAKRTTRKYLCPVCQLKHAEPGVHYFTKPIYHPNGTLSHWGPVACAGMAQ